MFRNVTDYLSRLWGSQAYQPATILLEMAMVGLVVYVVLRFLQGTRGARLLQGLVSLLVIGLLVIKVVADQWGLERIQVLMQPFLWIVLFTTLIVFQPELRRGLMRLGETRWRRASRSDVDRVARPIVAACAQLSKNKIGALIAIERDIGLGSVVDQGVRLDARLSAELINTIFWPGSALHDLGVVIQRGRIAAAGCQFPLSEAEGLDASLGSRHRAALGMSYDSDAVVVVVSEETGIISIAERGLLHRPIAPDALLGELRRYLVHALVVEPAEPAGGSDALDRRDNGLDSEPPEPAESPTSTSVH